MGVDSTIREYHPAPVEKNVFLAGIRPAPDPATVMEQDNGTLLFSLKDDQRWLYNKLTGQWAFIKGQIVPEYTSTELNNGTAGIVDSIGSQKQDLMPQPGRIKQIIYGCSADRER